MESIGHIAKTRLQSFANVAKERWRAGEVSFKGKKTAVRAHLLTAEEKAEEWPRLTKFWPNYDVYTERSGRDLRVFRLDPRA